MFTTTLCRPDLEDHAFGQRWRAFAQLAQASFFQDWTWVGCCARERYPDPVFAETRLGDKLVGMALFNRRRDRPWGETLHLHESGDPTLDAVFIEDNGPLVASNSADERRAILIALLGTAAAGRRRLILSGVGADCVSALRQIAGRTVEIAVRQAPYVDLTELPAESSYTDSLSRNTRHQLRRSNRLYAEQGALELRRAETIDEGRAMFERMVALHQATWAARGKAGAFANSAMRRFHETLLAEGIPRGEIDMLEITAGPTIVGNLMNFNYRGNVSSYQSGFHYCSKIPQYKPGMTSHGLAIDDAISLGRRVYDFMAGASRYKTSLSNAERSLYWIEHATLGHPSALTGRLRRSISAFVQNR